MSATMTVEKILALEGIPLRVAVAERILGYTRAKHPQLIGNWWNIPGGGYANEQHLPPVESDMAAAGRLMERMVDQMCYSVGIYGRPCIDTPTRWSVGFDGQQAASGSSLPTAICRAALLTVCGEDEDELQA